ncbi:heat shock 22 kDa protein, mitochondrial-like [Phoenix dactylifera]|uniref:Heat shock 22 kDa protein, mitochondrial-like n=1 Tax=Phoenix dactylifera TaxID=42345 RepID=A0A8B7BNS0_PHODC|nr:heat shock 22 kDa protein, mitochondrial-like [Phoenix dactylifera]
MAAKIAFPVSKLLEKLHFSPIRSALALAPFRSFSATETRDVAGDTRTLDIDRRTDVSPAPRRRRRRRGDLFPSFFSDAFDPFNPTRSLSRVLNLMDQMAESPFATAWGTRAGWDAREEEDALYLRVEMPGLGKEDVSVTAEQNTLVIKGEGGEEEEGKGEEEGRGRSRYSSRIYLPPNLYKIDGIRAEMKNGVLKVVVPKVKDEERKDVVQVQIE